MRLGTDIIEIKRVQALIERHGEWCKGRVFTALEWQYCMSKKMPYASFAARFAAKEAVAKVFGVGFGAYLKWASVEILLDNWGAPYVHLDVLGDALLKKFNKKDLQISLSHSKFYALAVVIME